MTRKIYYSRLKDGKGPKTVLFWLHGWGQTHESFLPLAGLFKSNFDNWVFDLPGFGKTPALLEDAGPEDYADALIQFIETQRGPAPVLIGHSFGGRVAIRLAAKRPDLVKGLVLIAGAGLQRKRGPFFKFKSFLLKTLGKLAAGFDGIFKTRLKEKYRQKFGSKDYREAGILLKTFIKTVQEDLSDKARRLQTPALLLYGDRDTETPPDFGERYQSLIEGSQLKILQGFGHLDILTAGRYQCQHHMNKFLVGLGE